MRVGGNWRLSPNKLMIEFESESERTMRMKYRPALKEVMVGQKEDPHHKVFVGNYNGFVEDNYCQDMALFEKMIVRWNTAQEWMVEV